MGFFFLLCAATLGMLLVVGTMVARVLFWIVLLPFRLLFGVLLFPFWLLKTALKLVGVVLLLPILAVAGGLALIGLALAALVTIVVPLAPILLVGLLLWVVIRSFSRRPVAA
jgi:hypothetical protein